MKLDLNKYVIHDRSVGLMAENPNYKGKTKEAVSAVVAYTSMPVLSACIMLGKYIGYSELTRTMLVLQDFYRYDQIGGLTEYRNIEGFPKELLEICDD